MITAGHLGDGRGGGHHPWHRRKHGLDLAEFEALTAQLHLEVAAAQVFDVAAGVPAGQVAGAVQA